MNHNRERKIALMDIAIEFFSAVFLAAFGTDKDDFIGRLAELLTNKKTQRVEFTPKSSRRRTSA
jgi:hypothetical protein